MLRVVINGKFASQSMRGIVRYARELLVQLDELLDADDDVVLLVPKNAHELPTYQHIRVKRYGHLTGTLWEQVDLSCYMALHRSYVLLNLCNVAPVCARPGVTTIHDVMYKTRPEYYTTLRNRASRAWHCFQYRLITRRERMILTVSEFSKQEIERFYPRSLGKVHVVPNAWQHVLRVVPSADWRERYPQLVAGEYLYSMATLMRNKNGRWIYDAARHNPRLTFAVAGERYESDEVERPSNVLLLGYVSDEDACALTKNCKAFLHPSLYEGFGLPPLEALALGASVVSSDATSLPEVLGDAVHYIDPTDPYVDLEEILQRDVAAPDCALSKYSWSASSKKLYDLLSH